MGKTGIGDSLYIRGSIYAKENSDSCFGKDCYESDVLCGIRDMPV